MLKYENSEFEMDVMKKLPIWTIVSSTYSLTCDDDLRTNF